MALQSDLKSRKLNSVYTGNEYSHIFVKITFSEWRNYWGWCSRTGVLEIIQYRYKDL